MVLTSVNTRRESANRMEPGSFKQCPEPGQEAVGKKWPTGGSV